MSISCVLLINKNRHYKQTAREIQYLLFLHQPFDLPLIKNHSKTTSIIINALLTEIPIIHKALKEFNYSFMDPK